jgi:hypothetical protein
MSRKWTLRASAALALVLAVVLAALATDVLRVSHRLAADDARFDALPQKRGLWFDLDPLPGRPSARLLGTGDDVVYRRILENFLRVQPGKVEIYGPALENLFGKVQYQLARGSTSDPDPRRRSVLLNLAGATSLAVFTSDPTANASTLRKAIGQFRTAIDLDPGNTDAKVNLELALRNAKAANIPGTGPDAGASEGSLSGQGRSGTGY